MNLALNVVGTLGAVLLGAAWLVWAERRLLALWQDRYGPNRVGPWGLLQPVADTIKLFTKEDWVPPFADRPVFVLAPAIVVTTVLLAFAVVPVTPSLGVVDLDVGLLVFFALSSLGTLGVVLAGWSSNNKYALLGGLRAAAQLLSYEVFMGLSLLGVVMLTGSLDLREIVLAQQRVPFVVTQFVGFIVFLIAAFAVTHRIPFDLPEAEAELGAGFHTEYSGMKFGMFFVAEYLEVILISSLITVIFLGGWLGPILPPLAWFGLKSALVAGLFILVRAALPRLRFDQLMGLGWKVALPLAILNFVGTATYVFLVGRGGG